MLKEGRRIKGKRVFSEDIKLKNIRSWGLFIMGGCGYHDTTVANMRPWGL